MEPTASTNLAGRHHDLTLLAAGIPRGPRRNPARAFQRLLFHEPDIANRGQLWTGLWSPWHRTALGPALQLCSLKDGQKTLLELATWATAGVQQLWLHFKEYTAAQAPFPSPPDTPETPHVGGPPPLPEDTTSGRPPLSPHPRRRSPAVRPPPEPPPRITPLLATPPGPDSGLQRTPLRTSATKRPRSHSPYWPNQESADHG